MKDIDAYLDWTNETAVYPGSGTCGVEEVSYLTLGLAGESGEVAEKTKKLLRDGTYSRDAMKKELGDVFWYLVRLCKAHGLVPSEVIAANVQKLQSRKDRGKLQGSGDER